MKSFFTLTPGAIFLLSAIYFFGGLPCLAAMLISVCVHELGHASAIRLFGGRVHSLRFDSSGLCMDKSGAFTCAEELVAIMSGPAAGLLFAVLCAHFGKLSELRFLNQTAAVSFALSVYNLVPALPLDGGRALLLLLPCRINGKKMMFFIGTAAGFVISVIGLALLNTAPGLALAAAGVWIMIAQTGLVKSMRML